MNIPGLAVGQPAPTRLGLPAVFVLLCAIAAPALGDTPLCAGGTGRTLYSLADPGTMDTYEGAAGALSVTPSLVQKTVHWLPLGDSITQFGTYFSPLRTLLSNSGYAADMIANEGHSGYIIDGTIPGATGAGLRENINTFLNHPNVNSPNTYILMMIGTNDVNTNCVLDSAAVQARMSGLIGAIEGIAPLSHLIVAQIVPNLGSIAQDTAVRQFNLDVAACVATAKKAGMNVTLVDMYDAFTPSLYTPYTGTWNPNMGDTLHPNKTGGAVMAQVWFNGIQAIPEPATLSLLALGGLAMLRRRRK